MSPWDTMRVQIFGDESQTEMAKWREIHLLNHVNYVNYISTCSLGGVGRTCHESHWWVLLWSNEVVRGWKRPVPDDIGPRYVRGFLPPTCLPAPARGLSEGMDRIRGEECQRRVWAIEWILVENVGLSPYMMLGVLTVKSYWTLSLLKWQVFVTKSGWKPFYYLRINRLDLELSWDSKQDQGRNSPHRQVCDDGEGEWRSTSAQGKVSSVNKWGQGNGTANRRVLTGERRGRARGWGVTFGWESSPDREEGWTNVV